MALFTLTVRFITAETTVLRLESHTVKAATWQPYLTSSASKDTLHLGIELTCLEDSLRSVRKSSQTWRNVISLRPCYRPSQIVTSFYRGKEHHLIKGK
jgi:hypothetical protein